MSLQYYAFAHFIKEKQSGANLRSKHQVCVRRPRDPKICQVSKGDNPYFICTDSAVKSLSMARRTCQEADLIYADGLADNFAVWQKPNRVLSS